ncbi:hypothetical protein C0R04_30480 [Streptomyces albidoflavus]|nr:hypothetical protein C0R04_30480 [Streptomyces albidoflavus]RZE87107.1 hypothetical protein C0R03_30485 [Streptomyces albidoflavus]
MKTHAARLAVLLLGILILGLITVLAITRMDGTSRVVTGVAFLVLMIPYFIYVGAWVNSGDRKK